MIKYIPLEEERGSFYYSGDVSCLKNKIILVLKGDKDFLNRMENMFLNLGGVKKRKCSDIFNDYQIIYSTFDRVKKAIYMQFYMEAQILNKGDIDSKFIYSENTLDGTIEDIIFDEAKLISISQEKAENFFKEKIKYNPNFISEFRHKGFIEENFIPEEIAIDFRGMDNYYEIHLNNPGINDIEINYNENEALMSIT